MLCSNTFPGEEEEQQIFRLSAGKHFLKFKFGTGGAPFWLLCVILLLKETGQADMQSNEALEGARTFICKNIILDKDKNKCQK